RHVGRRGEIAHRGQVVALVGENLRRPGEKVIEPLVVGAHSSNDRSNLEARRAAGGGQGWGGWGRLGEVARVASQPPLTSSNLPNALICADLSRLPSRRSEEHTSELQSLAY